MTQWQKVRVGDFLKLYRIEHRVQNDTSYKQVTISKTKGVIFRGIKQGSNIGRKRQFLIDLDSYPNTLLFTRQGIFDGSIGIAPLEVNQCIVTENMPMMSIDTAIIEIEFLKKLLISGHFIEKIKNLKVVGSAQKSIHERDFLKIEIDIPEIATQQKICQKFNALNTEHSDLKQEIAQQQILLKKLRQQILQEAIEGKLTQDWRVKNSNTEPASELLKRIQAEKQQLIKDKKIKAQKPLPAISEDEKPFKLPDRWVWCRLGEISINSLGKMLDAQKNKGNLKPYLRNLNVQWFTVKTLDLKKMPFEDHETDKYSVLKGDVVICEGGYPGQAAIWDRDDPIMFQKAIHRVRFISQCFPSLLFVQMLWLWNVNGTIKEYYTGAGIQHLTGKSLNKMLVPFPPPAEQKAIVAKVEKLLNICDKLQTQITNNQTYAEQLMQAVLKEAFTQSKPPLKLTA